MKYTRIFYSKESKYSHVKNNSELEGLLLLVALICQLEFMGIQVLFICTHAQLLSCVWLCDTSDCSWPYSISMGFSRQEYWSGLPFSPPGYLLNPGIEPTSPALAGRFFTPQPPGKSTFHIQAEKCQNDKETFTFLTFQKVRLKPKPISRSRPNKKWRETLVHLSVKFNCSVVSNSVTPWTAAHWASLSITNSWSLLKLTSIKSVMLSNHLILCHPLLLLPSIFPSSRIFSNESVLRIRRPKY